jgi:hypothetical protein
MRLTPLHYLCELKRGNPHPEITSSLIKHLLYMLVLYTANEAQFPQNEDGEVSHDVIHATYTSANEKKTIRLDLQGGDVSDLNEHTLRETVFWLIGSEKQDKLIIFQNVVARGLSIADSARNFEEFVRELSVILAETRWQYDVYIDETITKHFEELNKAKEIMRGFARDISESVNTLVKEITNSLVPTIGVILGFIVAQFAKLGENKIPPEIFRAGVIFYLVYFAVFAGAFRLSTNLQRYRFVIRDAIQQIEHYKARYGEAFSKKIVPFVDKIKLNFWYWFIITAISYALITWFLVWLQSPEGQTFITQLAADLVN